MGDINVPTLKIASVKSPAVHIFFIEVPIFVYFIQVSLELTRNRDDVKVVTDCSTSGYSRVITHIQRETGMM